MTLTQYTYSITGSFVSASGNVASDRLTKEIRESSITKALSHIDTADDNCDIWFKAALTTGSNSEKETLDGVVSVHNGQPLPSPTLSTSSDGSPIFALEKTQTDGAPLVAIQGRVGSEAIYASHNFCDPTTWYNGSVRVTSASLVQSGSYWTCSTASQICGIPWIDMSHGKMYDEEGLIEDQQIFAAAHGGEPHGYSVEIFVSGTLVEERAPFATSGGDYVINYGNGTVQALSDWTGLDVTASFSRMGNSNYYLEPLPGKVLVMEKAEVQFSKDIELTTNFIMGVEGYAAIFAPQLTQAYGGPLPNDARITIDQTLYKTVDQLVDESIQAFPEIPVLSSGSLRGYSQPRHIFQFHYAAVRKLYSSLGMRVIIINDNDIPFGGERATATFYCTSENDPGAMPALAAMGLV
jgi:hypothetical protein